MYYKFSGFSQKLVGAVASAAYVPQGLKPLASTESPTLIFGTPTKLASDSPAAVSYLGKNKVPDLQKLFQLEQALEFSLVKYRTLSTQHHLPAAVRGASNCSTMGFESGPWPKIWSRAMWWRSSRRTHHHPLTCGEQREYSVMSRCGTLYFEADPGTSSYPPLPYNYDIFHTKHVM
uniref:Uncharacterized protein n=1 Tax=Gopherus agassizii TaxID=38772 RepID=A0A452IZK0_9SAUR